MGPRAVIKTLLWPWTSIPGDARCVFAAAIAMPLIIHLYHGAPWVAGHLGIEDVQAVARAIFSLSFAAGCILVGGLVSRGGPGMAALSDRAHDWQAFIGHAIAAAGLTAGLMAVVALQAPMLAGADEAMTWRLLTGMAQGIMVAGWLVLWRVRHSWLSHAAAGIAALASAAGFGLYIVANFLISDPLTASWGWGVIHPQSIVARVTGLPWLEPAIGAALWIALGLLLRRWWRKAADGNLARSG